MRTAETRAAVNNLPHKTDNIENPRAEGSALVLDLDGSKACFESTVTAMATEVAPRTWYAARVRTQEDC